MNVSEANLSQPENTETNNKPKISPDNEGIAGDKVVEDQNISEVITPPSPDVNVDSPEQQSQPETKKSDDTKNKKITGNKEIEDKNTLEDITTPSPDVNVDFPEQQSPPETKKPDKTKSKKIASIEENEISDKDKSEAENQDSIKIIDKSDSSEETEEPEVKDLPKLNVNYSSFSREELVSAIKDLVSLHVVQKIQSDVDNIKICFYKMQKSEIEEKKIIFIKDGGKAEEFVIETDSYEEEFKTYLKRYRELKFEYNRSLDSSKKDNLKIKYGIIDRISKLIYTEESINKTFNEFKELQKLWYDTGPVPQQELNRLWETYHHHVEKFYDYININKELRDLDLKRNFEEKEKLCLRAEALLKEQSPVKAFKELQKLHGLWRETGPIHRDKKEEIWDRFKATTSIINKAHQHHYEAIREGQKQNLEEKTKLCDKVEEIINIELNSHKDWDGKSKEIIEIQKEWKKVGFAPPKDNNKVYKRFRTACDDFFGKKREFYTKNKEIQIENLNKKTELCLKAESLKDSIDWKNTTNELINIQKEWKLIGPVARKNSDIIWKRFRKACDAFFEKKSEHFMGLGGEQEENLKSKQELIKKIMQLPSSDDHKVDLKILKGLQEEWKLIGHVPFKMKDTLVREFRDSIDKVYSELNIDESSKSLLIFKQKIDQFDTSKRGEAKLFYERDKLASKLKRVETDIVVWENNIGFFAKSKTSEAMIKDFSVKIDKGKKHIETLKSKIRIIDNHGSFGR